LFQHGGNRLMAFHTGKVRCHLIHTIQHSHVAVVLNQGLDPPRPRTTTSSCP
jgi:hypothetical protein